MRQQQNMRTIFRANEQLLDQAAMVARKRGVSLSELIRRGLQLQISEGAR